METVDAKAGVEAAFISADDLLAAKLAAGRAQDLADAEALRRAQDSAKPTRDRPPKKNAPRRPARS